MTTKQPVDNLLLLRKVKGLEAQSYAAEMVDLGSFHDEECMMIYFVYGCFQKIGKHHPHPLAGGGDPKCNLHFWHLRASKM